MHPKGDEFEKFYYNYRQEMYAIAYGVLGNPADAEDAVSQAFLRISHNFRKISQLAEPEQKAYISVIVRNTSIDIYKGNKRRAENTEELKDDIASVDINLLEGYDFEQLKNAISELPKKYKDIIFLRYINDFSVKEISKMLDISSELVWKRTERAKKLLKDRLEGGKSDDQ